MEIIYKIEKPEKFTVQDKDGFLDLLKQGGKVYNPTLESIERCSLLCLCIIDDKVISIGAIKPKTDSDFNTNKANLGNLRNDFDFELGYCCTLPQYTRQGHSSKIVKLLLDKSEDINLMASTELRANNSMRRILENNGFKQDGKPWKSSMPHGGALGLFLKFV